MGDTGALAAAVDWALVADDLEREAEECKARSGNMTDAFAATVAVGQAAGLLRAAEIVRAAFGGPT